MSDAVEIQNNETTLSSQKQPKYTQKCQLQSYTYKMNERKLCQRQTVLVQKFKFNFWRNQRPNFPSRLSN